jgi:hypothetical protein
MPNAFQLISRDSGQPVKFTVIDEEICRLIGVNVHPKHYYLGWFDLIGFPASWGKNFDQIEEDLGLTDFEDDKWSKDYRVILKYLRENFHIRSWYEPRKEI